jgi:hypothetical protein
MMYSIVVSSPRKPPRVVGHGFHTYKYAAGLAARLAPRLGAFHTITIERSQEK